MENDNFLHLPFAALQTALKKARPFCDEPIAKADAEENTLVQAMAKPEKKVSGVFGSKPFADIVFFDKSIADAISDNISAESDKELFLNEMARPFKKKKTVSGFALAEHCTFFKKVLSCKKKAVSKNKSDVLNMQANIPAEKNEEADIFLQAAGKAVPLSGKGRKIVPSTKKNAITFQNNLDFDALVSARLDFATYFSDEYLEGHIAGMDELLLNRLRNGKMSPEAHLDLHGLNSFQAYEALRDFLRSCWFKGLRVVLLVPGRGLNSIDGKGILRQKLQLWLTQEPFKRIVLAFCTARPHDGGPGSIYVLLRKYRKKGKIFWERLPADADLY